MQMLRWRTTISFSLTASLIRRAAREGRSHRCLSILLMNSVATDWFFPHQLLDFRVVSRRISRLILVQCGEGAAALAECSPVRSAWATKAASR